MIVALVVTACGDADSQRQFANDNPPSAALPTTVPTPTPNSRQSAQYPATPVSVAQLLAANGGPARIYFQAGGTVWTANADGSGGHEMFTAGESTIKTLAASGDSSQVAVLIANGRGNKDWAILVLDAAGHQRAKIGGITAIFGHALPSGASATLSWGPNDDQLLLAVTGGGIAAIPLHGKPTMLVSSRQAAAAREATWSPAGNAIAFLDPATNGRPTNLFVARTGAVPLDPASIINGAGKRPITQFAWMEDGHDLLYIQARGEDGQSRLGGDVFAISAAGQHPQLVVSGGSAGPAAEVVEMALSPDGKSVAYTVFQPSGDGLTFLSLWVQRLHTSDRVRLPVPSGQTVTDLWWTKSGLVWRTAEVGNGATVYGGGPFSLYRADPEGNAIRELHLGPAELGTPAASPAATPNATLVGSPAPSPAATPKAKAAVKATFAAAGRE